MPLEWEQVIVDSSDAHALGHWWVSALDWVVVNDDPEEFEIRPTLDQIPGLLFVRVPEGKTAKNRCHVDLAAESRDAVATEVDRLVGLGATVIRPPKDEFGHYWATLQDPEGNELCIGG